MVSTGGGEDLTEVLARDRGRLARLVSTLSALRGATGLPELRHKRELVRTLHSLLRRHTELETSHGLLCSYPSGRADPDELALAHADLEGAVRRLGRLDPAGDAFDGLVAAVATEVTEHLASTDVTRPARGRRLLPDQRSAADGLHALDGDGVVAPSASPPVGPSLTGRGSQG